MPDQAGGSPYLKTESRFFRERNNRAKVHDGKSLEFARNKLDDRAASLIDLDFTHRDSFIAPPAAGRDDVAGYGLVADTQGVLGSGRALGTGLHHFDPEQPGMGDLGRPAHGIRRIHPVADIPLLIALDVSGRAVDLGVINRQPQRPVLGLNWGRLHGANLSYHTGHDHARDRIGRTGWNRDHYRFPRAHDVERLLRLGQKVGPGDLASEFRVLAFRGGDEVGIISSYLTSS